MRLDFGNELAMRIGCQFHRDDPAWCLKQVDHNSTPLYCWATMLAERQKDSHPLTKSDALQKALKSNLCWSTPLETANVNGQSAQRLRFASVILNILWLVFLPTKSQRVWLGTQEASPGEHSQLTEIYTSCKSCKSFKIRPQPSHWQKTAVRSQGGPWRILSRKYWCQKIWGTHIQKPQVPGHYAA